MKHVVVQFLLKATDWIFRPRTIAAQFIRAGVTLMAGTLSLDWALDVNVTGAFGASDVKLSTGNGLPGYMTGVAFWLSVGLIGIGVLVALRDEFRERRKLLAIVEVRGLHSSPDTPAKDSIRRSFRGQRHEVLVDFRPNVPGELVNPKVMLNRIEGMHLNLQSAALGRDKSDVQVAVGGLAAVPAMFLLGVLLEDESNIEVFDWDRDLKLWRMLDGHDDNVRFRPLDLPTESIHGSEVVLAVSASYPVDHSAIATTFVGVPVTHLTAAELGTNRYWSKEKQQACVQAFRQAIETLIAHQVTRIHLVLAAPASLAIQMGMALDKRLWPEVVVYQYEKSSTPPYPWGVQMPTHGMDAAGIVQPLVGV